MNTTSGPLSYVPCAGSSFPKHSTTPIREDGRAPFTPLTLCLSPYNEEQHANACNGTCTVPTTVVVVNHKGHSILTFHLCLGMRFFGKSPGFSFCVGFISLFIAGTRNDMVYSSVFGPCLMLQLSRTFQRCDQVNDK